MNNQHAPGLKRRLALLLLVSIINFVVSPVLITTTAANTKAAPINPFDGPTDFIRRIPLTTNDLVYSSTTGKIYASIPSSAGSSGNSIATIDPTTGTVTGSTFIGSEPNKLALSDDGHSLYAVLDGSFTIRRFDTLTNTPGLQFSLGRDPVLGRYVVRDFAVAPGNPSALAIAQGIFNVGAPQGVAIFDNGVRRPNVANNADVLAFSASASKLYGTGPGSGLQTMTVDASGVTVSSTSSLATSTTIKFANGLIFTSTGQVINPDSNSLLGTFADANTRSFVADPAVGRAYYLTQAPGFGSPGIKVFDINTFALLGSITVQGFRGDPTPLVRWGANGLAFRTETELFIIQTSLIPSAEPIPTPTPTPSPTPSPSPSPGAAAFVRTVALHTNDLIFNQTTQKLYASVPSSEGSTGNSVAEIDPVLGSITNQTFVGSEPTQLGQADDGETLYVGLDGAAAIRRYNMVAHTSGSQFYVGRHTDNGPYAFTDIAVVPGNSSVIAVARQFRNFGGDNSGGVAIFDNGVQRPNTGPIFSDGSSLLAFASPSVLYGNNGRQAQGLSTMSVDNSGVTVTSTAPFTAGNSMILDNNRLYGSTGEVINPTTGEPVGIFSGVSTRDTLHAVDSANGRAFFLVLGSSGIQIRAFDINTFLPVGFINVSGTLGFPTKLIRWGTNGLAFITDRQVVLIETALVNASVPVPSPTPIPSPTPSPSPPYIPTFVRRLNLPANNLVYSQAQQAFYASVASSAGANGNSITKLVPETGEIGPSVFIGSEPDRMAISSDGQSLWVRLNGANAFRRFDIMTQTPGLQFANSIFPVDMDVVPGSPQSLVMSKGAFSGGVVIFDDGVQRPNTGDAFPTIGAIEFGANPSVLYGLGNGSTGTVDLVKNLVDASGVTTSTVTKNLFISSLTDQLKLLKFSNGLLYSGSGRVVDPENQTWMGLFQPTSSATAMYVDAANHRVFFAFTTGGNGIVIRAFDSNTFLSIGSITVPGVNNIPVNLVRWGVNGLAFNAVPFPGSTEPGRVCLVQTRLVSDAGSIPVGIQLERDTFSVSENSSSLQVKVSRTGDDAAAISVNYATSDGTATAGSDYTAVSGTLNFGPGELTKIISSPIIDDNLFENGNETFNLTLSNATNSALLQTPTTATVTIFDNDAKPVLLTSSGFFLVAEGDSGTTNLTFGVTLTNPSVQVVTVDYATLNGTATVGSDYVASSGTITIPAGATSATATIPIIGDTTVEPNETFNIILSNATNVTFLGSSSALAIIVNDDASVQLSNTAFSVNEGAGFATVSVARVGDTSRAATVQFATTDAAELQACTLTNGKASERCDYGTSVGRVQFAVGETSKTIIIPIVDDALVEGDETFTVNLSGPAGATLGAANTATITIVDNDTAPASQNPIDGVGPFVTQQYIDFLGRLPDSIGFANWTATLGGCPNGGFGEFDNPGCDRVHVSAGFFLSEEFRVRGYWAYKFYEVGLDRRPTYVEFVPDMVQVGGPQSPQSEAISKAAYMDAFVQRPEFRNRYDALSNTDYVNALETNAEVTLTNKTALVDALNTNQKTRAQVLREIVEMQSVEDKFFIRAFVAMQYFGYLRRDPDTIGYANWVTTLTADPNNFRHMIFGFIYSDEYRHRFGP